MAGPAAETTEKRLRLKKDNPKITTEEIALACELTSDGVFYHTKKLWQQGLLSREGGRKDGRWIVSDKKE